MEEYDVRIDDNFLKADHVDGEVLSHTELNELENVTKTAINANYEDIQKIQDGTLSSGNADKLSDATLSTLAEETLQENDAKIPTSAQAKNYIDTQISAIDLSGYASTVYVDNADTSLQNQINGKQTTIDSSHKLNSDLVDDTNQTHKFVTSSEKTTWNAKYDKPSGGIPKTDLASAVQTSLGKADTAVQSTDYARGDKGGVIKINMFLGTNVDNNGFLRSATPSYSTYVNSSPGDMFISKDCLENVITGKGLVSNTDYATSNKGGVIKDSSDLYGFGVLSNGKVYGVVHSYSDYLNKPLNTFICKGTLENVLNEKIGNINTILATLTTPNNGGE